VASSVEDDTTVRYRCLPAANCAALQRRVAEQDAEIRRLKRAASLFVRPDAQHRDESANPMMFELPPIDPSILQAAAAAASSETSKDTATSLRRVFLVHPPTDPLLLSLDLPRRLTAALAEEKVVVLRSTPEEQQRQQKDLLLADLTLLHRSTHFVFSCRRAASPRRLCVSCCSSVRRFAYSGRPSW
jgi:hypothetical protein